MDPERILSHLKSKTDASVKLKEASLKACGELMNSGYNMQLLEQLVSSLETFDSAFLLLQTLKTLASERFGYKDMITIIDDSCYSISDWGRAIVYFLNHVEIPHDGLNLRSMISYLCCCAEATAANSIVLPFADQVEDMLDTFGYLGEN